MATGKDTIEAKLEKVKVAFGELKKGFSTREMQEGGNMNQMRNEPGKRVKFTPNTGSEEDPSFTPMMQRSKEHANKQDKNKLISGVWVRLSEQNAYEHLRKVLDEFGLQDEQTMKDYFRKEGSYLVRCSTLHWRNPESLRFICEYVPENILKEVLKEDNYTNIEGFLLGHSGLEEDGLVDEERLRERHGKLRLLLRVDPEGLGSYMESHFFKTQLTEGVKSSFRQAVEEYKKSRLFL